MPSNTSIWESPGSPVLPPLKEHLTADACVIGLGGSGLTCIEELLSMGRTVIGIDEAFPGAGAAGRNGGILRAGTADAYHVAVEKYGRDRAKRFMRLTIDEMERIADHAPGLVRFTGSIFLADTPADGTICAALRAALDTDGFAVENYDGPLGRGLFCMEDACFDPLARCSVMAESLVSRGAQLYGGTRAVSFTGHEVVTREARIQCDRVIVAVDGRLEQLVPELAGRVRTARLQMLGTEPEREVFIPAPLRMRGGFDYCQQLADGRIALGGGRDTSFETEWTDKAEPTAAIQGHLDFMLRERLKVAAPVTHRWAASVSYTPNGLPVIEEVRKNVWAIGGYCGTGNLMGAFCGRAVARTSCGESSEMADLLRA